MKNETTIALLIDCDNASHHAIEGVLNELAKYGVVNIRRAYGNWKSSHLRGWEEKLHPFAIVPIQQFCYTAGKNATDAAMIIDAMDLLYTHKPDAFALLTSDSDFTPLVMRLLTNGTRVFGFGEKKTPSPFVNACSQFIYTENLESRRDEQERTGQQRGRPSGEQLRADPRLVNVLRTAAEQTAGDDGWSHLGRMAQYISNKTSFSPVNFGFKKVSDLIKVTALYAIELRNNGNDMYVKPVDAAGTDAKPAPTAAETSPAAAPSHPPRQHHEHAGEGRGRHHTVPVQQPDPPISFRREEKALPFDLPEETAPLSLNDSSPGRRKHRGDRPKTAALPVPVSAQKNPAARKEAEAPAKKQPPQHSKAPAPAPEHKPVPAAKAPISLRELNLELKSGSIKKSAAKTPAAKAAKPAPKKGKNTTDAPTRPTQKKTPPARSKKSDDLPF